MVIILIFLLFMILGTFMDELPAILIFVPIIPCGRPGSRSSRRSRRGGGNDAGARLVDPPYGLGALTACAVAGIPVTRILRQFLIMIVALVAGVLACALVPSIVLILPQLMVPQWI